MEDIWGADATHIYAAGDKLVLFSTGDGTWTPSLTDPTTLFQAVWGFGTDAVYTCTNDGVFYRSNGHGEWSAPQVIDAANPTRSCLAIWGTSPTNLYLATSGGLYHGTN